MDQIKIHVTHGFNIKSSYTFNIYKNTHVSTVISMIEKAYGTNNLFVMMHESRIIPIYMYSNDAFYDLLKFNKIQLHNNIYFVIVFIQLIHECYDYNIDILYKMIESDVIVNNKLILVEYKSNFNLAVALIISDRFRQYILRQRWEDKEAAIKRAAELCPYIELY